MKPRLGKIGLGVAALAGLLAVESASGDALAANRIFKLHLQNALPYPVSLQLQAGKCFEGTPRRGPLGVIPQSGHVTITIARIQGHGCDGSQGYFTIFPSIGAPGKEEPQHFNFDNAGHLAASNYPSQYNGTLSGKSPADQSYTWTIKEKDKNVNYYSTYKFRHIYSKEYLIQHWHGNRDDQRTTRVWPFINGDSVYRWYFVPAGGGWNYIVNMKTGLVLTQDSGGRSRNVSSWGRLPDNHPHRYFQHWQVQTGPNNYSIIINRGSKQHLVQRSGGRKRDEKNVHVWPVGNNAWTWRMEQADPADLARLTIEKIRCIKVSTGQDANTKTLFKAIETASELAAGAATGGGSVGLGTVAKTAAKTAWKQGVRAGARLGASQGRKLITRQFLKDQIKNDVSGRLKGAISEEALKAGNRMTGQEAESFVELAFNKFYGESPDQLEIRVNNVSVWPNGGRNHVNIKSQQTMILNTEYIFERQKGVAIQLVEYDSGSNDDSLGWAILDTKNLVRPERWDEAYIYNKAEGSLYAITFRIEPLYPRAQNAASPQQYSQGGQHRNAQQTASLPPDLGAMLPGEYVSNKGGGRNWYRGAILASANGFYWANQAGNTWTLTPDLGNGRLMTGARNPWFAQGVREFKLVMRNGAVAGFRFGNDFFQKQTAQQQSIVLPHQQNAPRQPQQPAPRAIPQRQGAPQQIQAAPQRQTQQGAQQTASLPNHMQTMVVGNYVRDPVQNGWHKGAILGGDGGRFTWHNHARRSWSLVADYANRRLVTGTDNPYYRQGPREFKLVLRGGQVVGFRFGNDFYRKMQEPMQQGVRPAPPPQQAARRAVPQPQGAPQRRRQNPRCESALMTELSENRDMTLIACQQPGGGSTVQIHYGTPSSNGRPSGPLFFQTRVDPANPRVATGQALDYFAEGRTCGPLRYPVSVDKDAGPNGTVLRVTGNRPQRDAQCRLTGRQQPLTRVFRIN